MVADTWRVITHFHSCASNGAASNGHALINAFVRREFGPVADLVEWFECGTSLSVIEGILQGERTRRPVELLLLTDHMSPGRHVIDEPTLDLARRCHRFAIGAEVRTCLPNGSGGFMEAPEVLLYGPAELHESPGGGHYGLTQALVDEAFETCTRAGAPVPDTHQLRAFCGRRRIACALAHPLDGHALPLPQLLDVITSFRFIETINGGYSQANARLLERLLAALRRQPLAIPAGTPGSGPRRTRADREPVAFVTLGGSDAHVEDFDRVVTLFSCEGGRPDAGALLAAMLRAPDEPGGHARFRPSGHGISSVALHWEVLRLIVRNVNRNRHLLSGWRRLVGVLGRGAALAGRELRARHRTSARTRRILSAWLLASERAKAASSPQFEFNAE